MEKNTIYVLVGIGAILGAILAKVKKEIPWWVVVLAAIAGGFLGFFALDAVFSDFVLGAAAGAVGPYLFGTAIAAAKKIIKKKGNDA